MARTLSGSSGRCRWKPGLAIRGAAEGGTGFDGQKEGPATQSRCTDSHHRAAGRARRARSAVRGS
jgi:hypothetical protein